MPNSQGELNLQNDGIQIVKLGWVSLIVLYQNLTWARLAERYNVTSERSLCTDQVPLNQGGRSWSAQELHIERLNYAGKPARKLDE